MIQLIRITEQDGKQAVSARELHKFLEATERFSNWFERQLQFGFIEGVDYIGCKQFNALANQELMDYALTINCAKEISMLQRNEKGKQARQYFIEAENKYRELQKSGGFQVPTSFREALLLAAEQQEKIEQQQKQLAEQAPSVVFRQAVEGAQTSCLVGELAKLIAQNGCHIGEKRLFAWLRENGYLGRHGERYNVPNQTYIEQGLFELKKGVRSGTGGVMHTTLTTKVTGKGQVYFVNKFLKQQIV